MLRRVGGWDPYNVTEDADLGMRLARFGYRSVTFPSTTFEEAPWRFGVWLRQRSRWMKGWMQTWRVHMREPRRFWREAGPAALFGLNIIVGGNVLTALAHPFLLGGVAWFALALLAGAHPEAPFRGMAMPLHVATIALGYATTIAIGIAGLARRRQLRSAWVLALTPLYWIFLSIAAWRALVQLRRDPYRWEKTPHGAHRRGAPPLPTGRPIRSSR